MPKLILFSASCLLFAANVFAQSTPAADAPQPKTAQEESIKPLAYEVVSIKPSDPNSHGSGMRSMPGGFAWNNNPITSLIKDAYEIGRAHV